MAQQDPFAVIAAELEAFATERDWQQFHSPKNLAMALSVEVGELLEHFQWLTESQSMELDEAAKQPVAQEIADVQIYLIRLAEKIAIDILAAIEPKLSINRTH